MQSVQQDISLTIKKVSRLTTVYNTKQSHNILCLYDDFTSMFCFPMLLKKKSPSIIISVSVTAMVAKQRVSVFQVSYCNTLQRTGRNPDLSTKNVSQLDLLVVENQVINTVCHICPFGFAPLDIS